MLSRGEPVLKHDEARSVLKAVKERLATTGQDDDVLPEYVMVMLQNGKSQPQLSSELEAFMGCGSSDFANWVQRARAAPRLHARATMPRRTTHTSHPCARSSID